MAKLTRQAQAAPLQPPIGTVRACALYGGEIARHRLISADGQDMVVTTTHADADDPTYCTGAYPVQQGYLVMMRQPVFEARSLTAEAAMEQHTQLVDVLVAAGVGVVRARKRLAARQLAERQEAARQPEPHATGAQPSPRAAKGDAALAYSAR